MTTRPRHHRGGFTLLEALLASVVLAASITAVTLPLTVAAGNEVVETRTTAATGLAEGLMEEILAKPFRDPDGTSEAGPEADEASRSDFDNIDDYHGYTESANTIVTVSGQVVSETVTETLSRQATAEYVHVSGQDVDADPDFIRVTVSIYDGTRELVSLTRLVYALE